MSIVSYGYVLQITKYILNYCWGHERMIYTVCFIMFFYVLRLWLYSRFQSYFNSLDSLLNVSPYDTDHLIFRVDTNNQNDLILSHPFDVIWHPSNVTNRGRIVKLWAILLTHISLDKMAAISQRIYSNAFSWMKSFVFWFKCHWNLFLRANWQ